MVALTKSALLVSAVFLAATIVYFRHDAGRSSDDATRIHLHFYMHDEYTGPNPTAALIVPGRAPLLPLPDAATSSPRRFGDMAVMNNALTEGPERGSPRVGTAQGFTVRVAERGSVNALSMHLVMEAGEYKGSSLVVNGRVDTDLDVRESVVVGGTGQFRFARGYALSRSYEYNLDKGGIVEVNVYLY